MRTSIVVIEIGTAHKEEYAELLAASLALRHQVFCQEQGVPISVEQDGKEAQSGHIILLEQDKIVGSLRFRPITEGIRFERIVIAPAFRGQGYGRFLIETALEQVGEQERVVIHSQLEAVTFYERVGFTTVGESFFEGSRQHIAMIRSFESSAT